jgi:hypothetical protein
MRSFVLRLTISIGGLIVGAGASAQSSGSDCFLSEIDPSTKKVYQNKAQWDADLKGIWDSAPISRNPFLLFRGYEVSIVESRNAKGIGSDKRKHCYVGCRIAEEVGYDIAIYAGIYKEDLDLTDCKISTRFDRSDLLATLVGAGIAKESPGRADAAFCRSQCRTAIKR